MKKTIEKSYSIIIQIVSAWKWEISELIGSFVPPLPSNELLPSWRNFKIVLGIIKPTLLHIRTCRSPIRVMGDPTLYSLACQDELYFSDFQHSVHNFHWRKKMVWWNFEYSSLTRLTNKSWTDPINYFNEKIVLPLNLRTSLIQRSYNLQVRGM